MYIYIIIHIYIQINWIFMQNPLVGQAMDVRKLRIVPRLELRQRGEGREFDLLEQHDFCCALITPEDSLGWIHLVLQFHHLELKVMPHTTTLW